MYYKYIYIAIAIIVLPMIAGAAYNDVSLTTDTVLTVGSYTLTVSGSTAAVESIVVSATDLTISMPAGSSITVASADKNILDSRGVAKNYTSQTCSASSNTLAITIPSGGATETAVITPSATTCTVASTGAESGRRSGGGGGGGYTASAAVVSTVPAVVPTVISISATFSDDLFRGITNSDVSRLQQLLAQDKTLYPEGLVTGYFGPATESAVRRFQTKYGISPIGRVGPATRAKLAEVFSMTPVVTPAVSPTTPVSTPVTSISGGAVFIENMSLGVTGNEVKRLQQLLNTDADTRIATEGVGSPGNETTMFGSLTEKAVQKFQIKYSIAKEGDVGYGTVGPMTRAMLQKVFDLK